MTHDKMKQRFAKYKIKASIEDGIQSRETFDLYSDKE